MYEKVWLHRVRCTTTLSRMDPDERTIDDARALRALAHPLRQRIWRHLAQHGPATSASLAREFGVDRAATSFHLRQLGAHGFIEVDDGLSTGRRKYWRFAAQNIDFPEVGSSQAGLGTAVYSQLWLSSLTELVEFHQRHDPWRSAAETSHSALRLTEAELRDFTRAYQALLARFRRPAESAPLDARPVVCLFAAFPNEPPR